MKSVVILGAGFAGLELATRLSEDLPEEVGVTLIDSSDAFVFGYSKLDVMFGRDELNKVRIPYSRLHKPAVRFEQETVESIDPERRRVTTSASTYEPDILVVALGADLDPAATPGLVDEGSEYYSVAGAERVGRRLPAFEGGNVIIGVLGPFFKCPAAPFETALMLHDYLGQRGRLAATTIKIVSPMATPIPISPEASASILRALEERDIGWWPESKVTALDTASKVATLADGQATPVPVDHTTFATRFENVYAVGDVTSAPVPRVGAIAGGEARTLAEVIAHQIRGGTPPEPYRGIATCYIEFGGSKVARFDANFLSGPTPFGTFDGSTR